MSTALNKWRIDVERSGRHLWHATVYRLYTLDSGQEFWNKEERVQAPTEKKVRRGAEKRIRRTLGVEATQYSYEYPPTGEKGFMT